MGMAHHIQLLELFEKRIEYLKTLDSPISYNNKDYSSNVKTMTDRSLEFHSTNIPAEVIEKEVRSYVEQSGLKWTVYSQIVTDDFKMRQPSVNSCMHVFM